MSSVFMVNRKLCQKQPGFEPSACQLIVRRASHHAQAAHELVSTKQDWSNNNNSLRLDWL